MEEHAEVWAVIYTWRGERHVGFSGVRTEAQEALKKFREDRWNAWLERRR